MPLVEAAKEWAKAEAETEGAKEWARAEAETEGAYNARRSRRSLCPGRTEPRHHTDQSGSLDHRPGKHDSVRARTYWHTT